MYVAPNNGYTKFFVDLNGQNAASLFWAFGEAASPKAIIVDINPINGDNDFNFVGAKEFANPDYVSFIITASVIMNYTGNTPSTGEIGIIGLIEEYGGYAVLVAAIFALVALVRRR